MKNFLNRWQGTLFLVRMVVVVAIFGVIGWAVDNFLGRTIYWIFAGMMWSLIIVFVVWSDIKIQNIKREDGPLISGAPRREDTQDS